MQASHRERNYVRPMLGYSRLSKQDFDFNFDELIYGYYGIVIYIFAALNRIMKISLNWLKDYLDIPSDPSELEGILTSLGLEVEGMEEVQNIPGGLEGLVVGQVQTCGKHPNADRLSVTTVDIGQSELLHIVCGAPNVSQGQKVVVAQVGTTLYPTSGEPFAIKKGKIRGEVSEGMICAEDEIGIGIEHDGIIVLDDDAPVGSPVSEIYNVEQDTIFEIGLTPNRSDATSHIGVAKDLLAYYRYHENPDIALNLPDADIKIEEQADKAIKVEIRDKEGCPRFSGITLSNVKIGPSPDWIQRRLTAIGVRPISNVVDITNYVLHEYGQPLHAYDFDKISNKTILVQTLQEGTVFKSLDEKDRLLHGEDLIVCDGNDKGMCIAGVFGGIDSGVTNTTTDIFLEAAYFNALQLRKTSTRHQLRTDAAKCFEKGTDPAQTTSALYRAASLMCEYARATISSELVDVYPNPIFPKEILVRIDRVNMILGTEMNSDEIARIFDALGMEIVARGEDKSFTVRIPTNKADVTREIDVIEEILRIYGFNAVEVSPMLRTTIATSEKIDRVKLRRIMSDVLINQGFKEMMGLSLIPSAIYDGFEAYKDVVVRVNNTSNIHLDIMRPEMMMSALLAAQYNINRQQKELALFEQGRSYVQSEDGHAETEWLTITLSGDLYNNSWRQERRPRDFYDIKEVVLNLFGRLGIETFQIDELGDARFAYGLKYHRGPKELALLGAVSEQSKKAGDLSQDVFYAELNMGNILSAVKKAVVRLKEIPKFPSSKRDLALTLEEGVVYSKVETIIRKSSGSLLKEVQLFDIYRDKKNLGEGLKSYAVSLTFEDAEKNLKDKVIDKIVNKVITNLSQEVGAKLR